MLHDVPAPSFDRRGADANVAANTTYLSITASTLAELVGKNVFAQSPNDPDDPANVPRAMLRKSSERVLATGEPVTADGGAGRRLRQAQGRTMLRTRRRTVTA